MAFLNKQLFNSFFLNLYPMDLGKELFFITKNSLEYLLKAHDYDDIQSTIKILKDFIEHAPFLSELISQFILACTEKNSIYEEEIVNLINEVETDKFIKISKFCYANNLGFKTNGNHFESPFNKYELECPEFEEFNNDFELFYCHSILKELSFNKAEICLNLKVRDKKKIIKSLFTSKESICKAVLVDLSKNTEFLIEVLHSINLCEEKFKILPLLFVSYLSNDMFYSDNSNNAEEIRELFRGFIAEKPDVFINNCGKKFLNKLMNSNLIEPKIETMKLEDFKTLKLDDKMEFLSKFIILASPSVSHFLSYLEMYKEHFVLNSTEKEQFVKMLNEFHISNPSYLSIIIPKLKKFNIIN